MPSSLAPPWLAPHGLFATRHYGSIQVRQTTEVFGFQIRACNPMAHPSLIFAIAADSAEKNAQFAVRVDLDTGEIWDVANKTGVIGWLEHDLWPNVSEEYPLILRWEVEHTGSALIPRLQIGEEEWLYPSVLFPGEAKFSATAGHSQANVEISDVFSPGYVWCQDRLPKGE